MRSEKVSRQQSDIPSSANKLDPRQHFRQSSSFDRSHSRKRPREPSLERAESALPLIPFIVSYGLIRGSRYRLTSLSPFESRYSQVVHGDGKPQSLHLRFEYTHSQPPDQTAVDLREFHAPPLQQQCCGKILENFLSGHALSHNQTLDVQTILLTVSVCESFRPSVGGEEKAHLTSIT